MPRSSRRGAIYQGTRCGIASAMRLVLSTKSGPNVPRLLIPDTWVDIRVENVHQQICQEEYRCEDNDDGLHHLKISRPDGIHSQQASARPGEDALDDDRAGEQHARGG